MSQIVKYEITVPPTRTAWNDDQVQLIKSQIAKGCTDAELDLFGQVCQRTGLDPFSRQIYAISRGGKMTIQLSIDGFRTIAARSGLYGGSTTEWCGEDGIWRDVWLSNKPPAAAKTTVYRKGCANPFTGVARYGAYQQGNTMWSKMPDVMLGKCLPARAEIQTNLGSLKIRDIVNNRLPVKVRSMNLETLQEEWKSVTGWYRNGSTTEWVQISLPNKLKGNPPLTLTKEHPVLTKNGWVDAGNLALGDLVAVTSPTLSTDQEQVLIGSLLGDGYLSKPRTINSIPHFSEAHCISQVDYAMWKQRCFSNIGTEVDFCTANNKIESEVVKFRTLASPCLYPYRQSFYSGKDRQLPVDILDKLDDLGVAVWIMDDGCIKSTNSKYPGCNPVIRLYTCAIDNQTLLKEFFENRYGIFPKILFTRPNQKNPYLVFSTVDTAKLLLKLSEFITYDPDSNTKKWIAKDIKVGYTDSFVFLPVTNIQHRIDKPRKSRGNYVAPEGKYDIQVEDNHNFIYNNVVVHNCSESLALRKAFPAELSGLYTTEEFPPPEQAEEPKIPTPIELKREAVGDCLDTLGWTKQQKIDWAQTISGKPSQNWGLREWEIALVDLQEQIDREEVRVASNPALFR